MIIRPHVQAICTAILSRRPARLARLMSLALFLLPFSQAKMLAQQPYYGPQPGPYGQGYAPPAPAGMYAPQQYPPQQQYASYPQPSYPQQPYQGYQQQAGVQPLGAEQLEQLLAPIALYPDALLAQVLTASTYPDQVQYVNQWRESQGNASPQDIAAMADQTNWDPSLKALTAFPQVLDQMARNPQWTRDLGNTYYNQPQDVLGAVQVLRQRAQAAGTLQSTPQEAVRYYEGNIQLAPQDPNMVYVPSYNPWNVYGQSVSPYPGFSLIGALGQFLGSSPVSYGLGILMSAFNNTPFGWVSWALNWLTQSVLFQHNSYFTHSTSVADWGFPHGGPRFRGGYYRGGYQNGGSMYARNSFAGTHNNFAPASYGRPGSYGSAMYGRNTAFNGVRPGSVYSNSAMYRQREPSYGSGFRSGFNQPGYRSPMQESRGFSQRASLAGEPFGKEKSSGGFHLFGGGHSSNGFSGGSHQPSFGAGHSMFSGHSSGGGHSFFGGHSGGGHSGGHSGGGGHSHGHHLF